MPPLSHRHPQGPYWRSLAELASDPELRELVDHGVALPSSPPRPSRRGFLKGIGASVALAGLAACRWPEETILPYAHRDPEHSPGVPRYFASSLELAGVATGVVVTSYDGRPIKIEGNPLHPGSLGRASAQTQAAVLGLYDPDRSRRPVQGAGAAPSARSWDEFSAWLQERVAAHRAGTGGGDLRILSTATSSPTFERLALSLQSSLHGTAWHSWEPVNRDNELEGGRQALGRPVRPLLGLGAVRVLVSLDADLLHTHPDALRLAGQLAAARDPDGEHPLRLLVAEAGFSVTGAAADQRWALAPSAIPGVGVALALRLLDTHGLAAPVGSERAVSKLRSLSSAIHPPAWVDQLARALATAGDSGLLVVGAHQPPQLHALAWLINGILGSRALRAVPVADRPGHRDSLAALVQDMQAGEVSTLLILGANPIYDAPADLEFAAALAEVAHSVHLGAYRDETGSACGWHLPQAHALESWGDARAWDGTISLVQPLIEPLYGGRSSVELLGMLLGGEHRGHTLVRETHGWSPGLDPLAAARAEHDWAKALQDGFIAGTATPTPAARLQDSSLAAALAALPTAAATGLELVFRPCAKLHDGRFANNAWLQELPDPISKLTWDNAALLGPSTAAELAVSTGDLVELIVGDRRGQIAALVLPGVAAGSVLLPLGYGRSAGGSVAAEAGFDVYPLRSSDALGHATGAQVRSLGDSYRLAASQDHFPIDERGAAESAARIPLLVREADLATYREHPDFAQHAVHHPPLVSPWQEHAYEDRAWGMIIDLNRCTGCGACTLSCQAENNIPVVGKRDVLVGREMHWIRSDRYFTGDPEQPGVAHLPVPCMHCELAPCEQVCPVAATQHSSDGLNVMVYNRCVGTRYCANNCPYKVRRFNFFAYTKGAGPIEQMRRNPEVTVRSRGVMEKCSYCQQRISSARIRARNEGRELSDGDVVPACAQTCPSGAITFGDYNDPHSRLSALAERPRSYELLPELNLKQRTRYMARVRTPLTSPGATSGHEDPTDQHGGQG